MKIYSKFQDYYDNIGYYDKNDKVWVRKTESYSLNQFGNHGTNIYHKNGISLEVDVFLGSALYDLPEILVNRSKYSDSTSLDRTIGIGFCGKMYFGIMSYDDSITHIKTYSDINKYIEYRKKNDKRELSERRFFKNYSFNQEGINLWLKYYNNQKNLDAVFQEFNSPIFIIKATNNHEDNLIINPSLKDFKLQTIFTPYEAHQSIDQYINNQLVNTELNSFSMTDELKRDSKGMDEWSFRQKGPKKRKS